MAWCFVSDTMNVHVVELQSMSRTTRVTKLTEGQKMKTVKAHLEDDVVKLLSLDTFEADTEFSEGLDKVTESRTAFVKLFNDKVQKLQNEKSQQNEDSARASTSTIAPSQMSSNEACRSLEQDFRTEKLIGPCVHVHIRNLRHPSPARQVRPLDNGHIETLRNSFLNSGVRQTKLLAGMLLKGESSDLMTPGKADVEILGGNHSRAALESLYSSGLMDGTVMVTLYKVMSNEQALQIGVMHNLHDEDAMFMTFMEKVGVVKNIKRTSKKWSASATKIFGFKSLVETRNKLRVMSAVADLDEEIYKRIVALSLAWKGKKPLKQTSFATFVTKSVEQQKNLLAVWEHEGFQRFKREMKTTVPKKTCPEEIPSDFNQNDDATDNDGSNDADHAMEYSLRDEIESLKKENDVLRKKLEDVEEENVKLKQNLKAKEDSVNLVKSKKKFKVKFLEDKVEHEVGIDGLRQFGK